VVDRIIDHLKLRFVAAKPQPCSPHGFHEGRLMSSSRSRLRRRGERGIFLKRISCPDKLFERRSLWLFVVIDSAVQPAIYFQHS
jgi:hypothetical protein